MPPQQPWSIFTREMREKWSCYGMALWDPNPHTGFDGCNIDIGDVGRIEDGRFHRLLNTITGTTHPDWTLPSGFERLEGRDIAPLIKHENITQQCLYSGSFVTLNMSGEATGGGTPLGGLSLKCAKQCGAILQLPQHKSLNEATSASAQPPANGKRLSRNNIVPRYFARNLELWHRFAQDVAHWDVEATELVFVSGYFETKHWAVAACTDHGVDAQVSIHGGHAPLEVSFTFSASTGTSEFFHTKCGPFSTIPPRQCVFLDLYKGKPRRNLRTQGNLFAQVLSFLGSFRTVPHSDSVSGPGQADDAPMAPPAAVQGEHTADQCSLHGEDADHPMDAILDFILRARPDADVAVINTRDLHDLWVRESRTTKEAVFLEADIWCYFDDVVMYADGCDHSVGILEVNTHEAHPSTPFGGAAVEMSPRLNELDQDLIGIDRSHSPTRTISTTLFTDSETTAIGTLCDSVEGSADIDWKTQAQSKLNVPLHLHDSVPGPGWSKCLWGTCGINLDTSPSGVIIHLRDYHWRDLDGGIPNGRIRCKWTTTNGVCMAALHNTDIGKHVSTVHMGSSPFVCSVCGLMLRGRDAFGRHMNLAH